MTDEINIEERSKFYARGNGRRKHGLSKTEEWKARKIADSMAAQA